MAVEKQLMTADEFEEWTERPENRDRLFELINGEIVEKVPTEEHGESGGVLHGELYIYLKQHPIGRAGFEIRHRVPGDDYNSLLPDISVRTNLARPAVKQGPVWEMPALAIEIKSARDSLKSLREKAHYYLANGSRMVWLVIPAKRLVEVYTPNEHLILTDTDTLDGGDVLPGFSLSVRDIFPQ